MHIADLFGTALVAGTLMTSAFSIGEALVDYVTPKAIEGSGYYDAPVKPGDVPVIVWSLIKRTDCSGVSARVWDGQDGFHVSEALQPTGIPRSETVKTYRIPTRIPSGAPEGELKLRIIGTYCDNVDGASPEEFTLGPVVLQVVK